MKYIVYSHTDYLDILKIQTDFLSKEEKILFINQSEINKEIESIYNQYKEVILYDDKYPYASRLLMCLKEVMDRYEYALFIHDMDIVLEKDDLMLEKTLEIMKKYNFYRADLQYDHEDKNKINRLINIKNQEIVNLENIKDGEQYLRKDDYNNYPYNVNPSIWHLKSFFNLISPYPFLNYRNIELVQEIQHNARTIINTYKLYCTESTIVRAGYFSCLPFFKFLHITHGGKLLPLNETSTSIYNQSYISIRKEYENIIEKYDLKKSNKWAG